MITYDGILSFGSAATVYGVIAKLGETILSKVASADASSTRLAICAEVKDILLSVTEVVSDTNTACGEQSVDSLSKSLTQDCLARDAFFINSFVAGTGMFLGFQSQLPPKDSYLSSEIMQVACKWLVICIAA